MVDDELNANRLSILNAHWTPQNLGDGCHDFIMLLDGDGAYDYAQSGLAMRADVHRVTTRLREAGVEFKILDRYGLENYFPQHAFEAVLMRDLRAYFPLDSRRPVSDQIPGYAKNMNAELGRLTRYEDLVGTDLAEFLDRVARLAGE